MKRKYKRLIFMNHSNRFVFLSSQNELKIAESDKIANVIVPRKFTDVFAISSDDRVIAAITKDHSVLVYDVLESRICFEKEIKKSFHPCQICITPNSDRILIAGELFCARSGESVAQMLVISLDSGQVYPNKLNRMLFGAADCIGNDFFIAMRQIPSWTSIPHEPLFRILRWNDATHSFQQELEYDSAAFQWEPVGFLDQGNEIQPIFHDDYNIYIGKKSILSFENKVHHGVFIANVNIFVCYFECSILGIDICSKQVVFDVDFSGFDINPCFLSVQKDKKRLAFSSYENPRAFCTYILDETDFKNSVEG